MTRFAATAQPPAMEFDVRHTQGAFTLDARFEAGPGVTALFGRSGSGKTTIVNMIAGLVRPDAGRVVADGVVLFDRARQIDVASHKRRIGYVFQDGRLFPHLTVRQNLLYGAWFNQPTRTPSSLEGIVDLLGLATLLDRRPRLLSGGEKQRVAIGRALLAEPRALLMDEPLAALDEARKQEILPYLERLRDRGQVPVIYVTHAMAEVARLATTLVVLADGRVSAAGPAVDIMQRLDVFALTGEADAGALIEGTVTAHDAAFGLTVLASRAGTWRVPQVAAPIGTRVRLRVRSSDVTVCTVRPEGVSALNVFPGVIADVGEPHEASLEVRIDCSGDAVLARLTRFSFQRLALQRGSPVFALIKSVAIDQRGG